MHPKLQRDASFDGETFLTSFMAGTPWPAARQHSSGEGAATPRNPGDHDDDDKLPTVAVPAPPAVADATLVPMHGAQYT